MISQAWVPNFPFNCEFLRRYLPNSRRARSVNDGCYLFLQLLADLGPNALVERNYAPTDFLSQDSCFSTHHVLQHTRHGHLSEFPKLGVDIYGVESAWLTMFRSSARQSSATES